MNVDTTFLWFAQTARMLARYISDAGLSSPSFRAPPRTPGAHRALRRSGDSVTVAVRVQGRTREAVIEDLEAGVIAANMDLSETDQVRLGRVLACWRERVLGDLSSSSPARVAERQTQAA